MAKNGYLYVFVSNQSQQDVYFDDLTVTHTTGPLLQEQSYYPFGLQMSGISDKAINKLNNQTKFNGGVELEEDYGVNLYSTFYRQYDPQLGRFNDLDILSEQTWEMSGYQFSGNNPVSFNDPMGDKFMDPSGNVWHHADGLAGTLAGGQAYQYGYGLDGFGDLSPGKGGGGGAGESKSYGFNKNGEYGYSVNFTQQGNRAGNGLLSEVVIGTRFVKIVDNNQYGFSWNRPFGDGSPGNSGGGSNGKSVGKKIAIGAGLATDALNLSLSGAGAMSKAAVDGLKIARKTTGLIGVAIGGVLAVNDMIENGISVSNVTSLLLGAASVIVIFEPFGAVAEGVALLVDAATITNDVISTVTDLGEK